MPARPFQVINSTTNTLVAEAIEEATGWWRSFRGLMLAKGLDDDRGLLIRPARGIHTHFMRFPIDLIFLDERHRVTKVRSEMPPWRVEPTRAAAVIEVAAGLADAAGVEVGDQLLLRSL
jgi:uncharacterized membrane protein (UPF0127 family)